MNKNLVKPGRDEQNGVSRQVDLLSVLYGCPGAERRLKEALQKELAGGCVGKQALAHVLSISRCPC